MADAMKPTMEPPGNAPADGHGTGSTATGDATPGPTAHTGEGGTPQPAVGLGALHIRVDRQDVEVFPDLVHDGTITGQEIRELATPAIGADRDLFEIVPGGSDKKIQDGDAVLIRDHQRFFSAPRNINPGTAGGSAPKQSRCPRSVRHAAD